MYYEKENSLIYTGKKLNINKGIIITFDSAEDEIIQEDFKINIIPAYLFLFDKIYKK